MAEPARRPALLAEQAALVGLAVQYFTRLPWPGRIQFSQDRLDRSIRYLPLVGIVVGGATGLGYALAARIWPMPIAVALAMALAALLTGGLHEDGLADFCDGFWVARDRERTLAIMKDSRLGSHGALGLGLALLVRYAALYSMPADTVLPALVAAHAFSRLVALAAMRSLPYARTDGGAPKPDTMALGTDGVVIAAACGALPILFVGWPGLLAAPAAAAAGLVLAGICRRRIGGYTGDCLGAIQQVSELAFYLGVLA
jgi:adenosylcobinamide-GDP ribazoletransferase